MAIIRLSEIKSIIQSKQDRKKDLLVKMKDIQINPSTGKMIVKGYERLQDGSEGERFEDELQATAQATSQFFSKLGIPTSYAVKTPIELMIPHIDHWRRDINEDLTMMVRTYQIDSGERLARALVSERYGILDNNQVLEEMTRVFDDEHTSVRLFNTDEYGDMLNLRITDDRYVAYGQTPAGKSNPYFGGLHIVNGETGKYSVSASALIWEQWCANGAVRERYNEALMRKKHIGNSADLYEAFVEASQAAPELYEKSMASFQAAQEQKIEFPYLALYNLMKQNRQVFSDQFKVNTIEAFDQRNAPTRYGIASAITQAVQKETQFDRRMKAEKLAGDLLFFNAPLDSHGDEERAMDEIKAMIGRTEAQDVEVEE